jgi:putative transcriptional regulator
MKNNKMPYEHFIHKDFKKKILLKVNIILIPIFALLTLFFIVIAYEGFEPRGRGPPPGGGPIEDLVGVPDLLFWPLLFVVIIPYIVIMIILSVSLSIYIRNFSFEVLENNIIIHHGVMTKTKATIPFIQIQNINVVSGVFDRLFKIYTVKIETAARSRSGSSPGIIKFNPEGHIPGLKEPNIIEDKINEMMKKLSQFPTELEDKLFKPEELAFDNFISYVLSKIREGKELKTNIKELREKKSISSVQLAEKVGVPIQTIKYLEEGRYNPSLSLAYKIARVLNCKVEDLFQLA